MRGTDAFDVRVCEYAPLFPFPAVVVLCAVFSTLREGLVLRITCYDHP